MGLSHEPLNPVRLSFDGEVSYLLVWQRWADAPADPLAEKEFGEPVPTHFDEIFVDYRWKPGQREATIAASVISWLGTNCGRAFLEDARRIEAVCGYGAYNAAWGRENMRQGSVNGGMRALEALLTPVAEWSGRPYAMDRMVSLSGRDFEAAECVIHWISGFSGQRFLAECEIDLQRRRALSDATRAARAFGDEAVTHPLMERAKRDLGIATPLARH